MSVAPPLLVQTWKGTSTGIAGSNTPHLCYTHAHLISLSDACSIPSHIPVHIVQISAKILVHEGVDQHTLNIWTSFWLKFLKKKITKQGSTCLCVCINAIDASPLLYVPQLDAPVICPSTRSQHISIMRTPCKGLDRTNMAIKAMQKMG